MSAEYIRRCPSCGTENAPQTMRCACGAMLAGVDLSRPAGHAASAQPAAHATPTEQSSRSMAGITCPYEDCALPNPPDATACLYCNRPLGDALSLNQPGQSAGLLRLPVALSARYRIERQLPTKGAEAELLLVREAVGGPLRVAKVYRHGIVPRSEVQQRIARVDPAHRVEVLQSGVSDGYAYELMEYCEHGSLREHLSRLQQLTPQATSEMIRELAVAIDGVHAAGLLHRDLKPENILVRTVQPLDLVLTDFGTSSLKDATQRFTGMARTLPYASPESLSGVIDGKADYWSLGMIVLEATMGRHPFAGLSDAVILHHLTTRSIDLAPVADHNLRKLLRGLLLRNPRERWGIDEIRRWLAHDNSLLEPSEPGIGASFREPYHVGKEICHTNEQLAVALARNWQIGIGDMANGLLLSWFRDVQKDQNAMRVLLELRNDTRTPLDTQLLKFILHLAPGIPPVWRGETIELPAILAYADRALRGDEAAEEWLDKLYRYRVLENYAAAGNRDVADIVQKWGGAVDRFEDAWAEGVAVINAKAPARGPDEIVNFDQLVYGNGGSTITAPSNMHARLLACAYDGQWTERLRARLVAELTGLAVYCPWFTELGDPQTVAPSELLMLEALLPEARKVRDRQIKSQERRHESAQSEVQALKRELAAMTLALRRAAGGSLMLTDSIAALRQQVDHYFDIIARIKSAQSADAGWQALNKSAQRNENIARQLSSLVDRLVQKRAVNAGWSSSPFLGFALLALMALPAFLIGPEVYFAWAACAGLVVWRLAPVYMITRKINHLAARLSA